MPSEDTKVSKCYQYRKSDKAPFIIYIDLECIIEKIDECKNSSTTKVSKDVPAGLSMSTISLFISMKNKCDVYSVKDCMKNFCEFLRDDAMKVNNFKKKKVKLLTKEQLNLYENAKICYICKEKFEYKYLKDKNILS